jgi:hypothetical protein
MIQPNTMEQRTKQAVRATVIVIAVALHALSTLAQTAKDVKGSTPLVAIQNEPPAKIIVDPPIPEQLALGRVFIQYRTENLRILPVFGKAALEVSPRIGHLHYFVDDLTWPVADSSGETVTLVGLAPGPHKIRFELVDATHRPIPGASQLVEFTVPAPKPQVSAVAQTPTDSCKPTRVIPLTGTEPPAKIVIDPPLADWLASRGVAIIQYCAQNVHIAPVFGPGAATASPRVGHVHVSLDDASWAWAEASGNPIILQGLAPGPHKVTLILEDANHHLLDKSSITFVMPDKAEH